MEPETAKIPILVYREFADLLYGIDSACYCINTHLHPRHRAIQVNRELVFEIVHEILERHSTEFTGNAFQPDGASQQQQQQQGNEEEEEEDSTSEEIEE